MKIWAFESFFYFCRDSLLFAVFDSNHEFLLDELPSNYSPGSHRVLPVNQQADVCLLIKMIFSIRSSTPPSPLSRQAHVCFNMQHITFTESLRIILWRMLLTAWRPFACSIQWHLGHSLICWICVFYEQVRSRGRIQPSGGLFLVNPPTAGALFIFPGAENNKRCCGVLCLMNYEIITLIFMTIFASLMAEWHFVWIQNIHYC